MTRSYVRAKLVKSDGSFLTVDDVDNTLVGIDTVHHEIHEGNHYTVTVYDNDVDIAGPKIVRITTPNTSTRIHLTTFVSADGGFLFEFYENPTLNAAGAGLTEFNNDRNSSNTATATTFEDTTTQAPNNDGTLLDAGYSGGEKKRVSGESGTRDEFILKQDEDYLVKLTVDADNTKAVIVFKWYEV
jgi:hypothetical protein